MVNQSFTAVVERAEALSGAYATEPYEVAWAREAVVFLKTFRLSEGGRLTARIQISPDGVEWVDDGTAFSTVDDAGLNFVKVDNFGGWLRVAGEVHDDGATADIAVYIALKA